ncbi:MAG: EAL domain-containing protein [Alphaproteobacteria bacterium]
MNVVAKTKLVYLDPAEALRRRVRELEDVVARMEASAADNIAQARELATGKDLIEQARASAEVNAKHVNAILDAVLDGIFCVDASGIIKSANMSVFRMLNCSASQLVGARLHDFLDDPEEQSPSLRAGRTLDDMVGKRLYCVARRRGGTSFPAEIIVSRAAISDQVTFTCVLRDVTEQKRAEREIQQLALFDPLTSVANRYEFEARLNGAIRMADRQGLSVALMLLDLDKFKDVNDGFGHPVGDALLKHTARVLERSVRQSDTVARIGGDEFAIILNSVEDPLRIRQVADRIVEELSQPVVLNGNLVPAGASIGIGIFPRDARDANELIRLTDQALYESKKRGRGTFQYYDELMDRRARHERTLETDLRVAIVREEFELHYQPQVDSRNGALLGVEALVRWRRPDGTLVMPGKFIQHAEKTGIINEIGSLVLRAACREARCWLDAGVQPFPVAVNVSPSQFRNGDFIGEVETALEVAGIGSEWLELEVTENIALDTSSNVLETFRRIEGLGVGIAIDDFGTGFASFAYLRKFPLRKLKIDRSLVRKLTRPGPDRAITEAIVNLGRSLNYISIAEGVETDSQAAAIRLTPCSGMQGFLFSRPLPAEDFRGWLRGRY